MRAAARLAAALILAGGLTAAGPNATVQTWRVEGVVHDVEPAEGVRPPVLMLAPGFSERSDGDQDAIVDEVARAIAPPAGPRLLMIRAPDRSLLGRWTRESGFQRLN